MRKMPREYYVPKGARCFRDRNSSAVLYSYERDGPGGDKRYFLIGFHGRAQKPDFQFYYQSAEKREAKANSHFACWQAVEARVLERRKEKAEFVHDFKVGDVFVSSWGYDQTNVDYYECVGVRGKHLIVREIGGESADSHLGDRGRCAPSPGSYRGEPIRVLAQPRGIKVDRHWASYMKPLAMVGDKPVYESNYWSSYA